MKLNKNFVTHDSGDEQIMVATGDKAFAGLIRNNKTAAFIFGRTDAKNRYRQGSICGQIHDVYKKNPIYNFEMHTALYGKGHQEGWEDYYREVKKRLIPVHGSKFGFHFREEEITGITKCRYFLKRLIPDKEYYLQYTPFVYQDKWLIPGFVVYRILRGIVRKGKQIWSEVKLVWKMEK